MVFDSDSYPRWCHGTPTDDLGGIRLPRYDLAKADATDFQNWAETKQQHPRQEETNGRYCLVSVMTRAGIDREHVEPVPAENEQPASEGDHQVLAGGPTNGVGPQKNNSEADTSEQSKETANLPETRVLSGM